MKVSEYKKKKDLELEWYKQDKTKPRLISRILRHPLLFNPERNSFNYIFPKKQMARIIKDHNPRRTERMLIAPCGTGDDFKYVKAFARDVHGIDLSPIAVNMCPKSMKANAGDILKSGYPPESFDIVVSPLFFHHLLRFGFHPFLKEFHRIMKKGGQLVILEPSIFYPINIITRPMKKVLKNPYGEVEDESPFRPKLLTDALKKAGFKEIEVRAASFSHCSFFVPVAIFFNFVTKPLLKMWPFNKLGWMVVYWARK